MTGSHQDRYPRYISHRDLNAERERERAIGTIRKGCDE